MIDIYQEIPKIALGGDVRLAYWLAISGLASGINTWKTHTITATFTSQNVDQPFVSAQVEPAFCNDTYVYDMSYQVRRPNAYVGNILKGQSDHFNSLNPNVDVTLRVSGGADYFFGRNVPIEHLMRQASQTKRPSQCSCFWVLDYCETPAADFRLRRTLAPEELPYIVTIAFSAIRLPCKNFYNIPVKTACDGLTKLGFDIGQRLWDLAEGGLLSGKGPVLGDPNSGEDPGPAFPLSSLVKK